MIVMMIAITPSENASRRPVPIGRSGVGSPGVSKLDIASSRSMWRAQAASSHVLAAVKQQIRSRRDTGSNDRWGIVAASAEGSAPAAQSSRALSMFRAYTFVVVVAAVTALTPSAIAAPACGGNFQTWLAEFKQEASSKGISQQALTALD